ncbi:hypothetical protein QOZ80_7AG0566140 [Eleusine coracana subsp. coracana]|nr:hypothetical protein QOZ80_7AG0566140 [Eleusine coracana subsp. coracana]
MAAAGWFLALAGALTAFSCSFSSSVRARPTNLGLSSSSSTSLDCPTMTSLLADCGAFVTHGAAAWPLPAPGTPCCAGVTQLYAVAADSADNWRSVCDCMAALVRQHSSKASAIALLPVVCGVLPGRHTLDNLTYCTSPP